MKTLMNVKEATALIEWGKPLMVAGAERLLRRLPQGNWVGGTIPYFMSEEGGLQTAERLLVTRFPDFCNKAVIKLYSASDLPSIPADYPANGVSFVILPAGSEVHSTYARDCSTWPGLFDRPLAGWVSGVDLEELAKVTPKVFNGVTGEVSTNAAAVMHLKLPSGLSANVAIVNLFEQGDGDTITFPASRFDADDCFVNGARTNFADYLASVKADSRWPLVANYAGAKINVSFQGIDSQRKRVTFYAPVFEGVEYKLAKPQVDFRARFDNALAARRVVPLFTCNCILNYLYAELEGKRTGDAVGPITFGEVAWMLLNQTMVYVSFEAAE
jgi:hypothetical protein